MVNRFRTLWPARRVIGTSRRQQQRLVQLLSLAFVSWVCSVSASTTLQGGADIVPLVPVMGLFGPRETLAYWQMPPSGSPRKLLVIFEARRNFPYWFWDRSSTCPVCIGKPEHRKIVVDALSNNYAVLVPTSTVDGGDWESWPPNNEDLTNVVLVITEWKRLHGFENLPTVAVGSSAGGHALSIVALSPGMFESIAVMISVGIADAWEAATSDYPPTIFMHMPKDSDTAESIASTRKILAAKNVLSGEGRLYESPLSTQWFTGSIRGMQESTAAAIIQALRHDGFLTDHENDARASMILNSDDMMYDWHERMARWNILPEDPQQPGSFLFEQAILDELFAAYALHITFSRKNVQMFEWFDGGYRNARNSFVDTI